MSDLRANWLIAVLITALVAGCGAQPESTTGIDRSKYLLKKEPLDARDVIAARESVADGDEVVIVGRIGGSVVPWVEDVCAFTIVDASLKSCHEVGCDDCPKPWDYC